MDWEQYRAKKPWAGEAKPSMKRRRVGHDYHGRCIYMLTLTVKQRRPLFGHIPGNGDEEPAVMHLTPLGQAVSDAVQGLPGYYPAIEILACQLMPDHLHVVIFVHNRLPVHLGQVISGFKAGCNRAYRNLGLNTSIPTLWEEGFNDTILDGDGQLQRMIDYVSDNPRRYAIKRAHPDLFRVRRHVTVGEHTFAAMGNIFLLDAPQLIQVQCSRKITPGQLAAQRDHCLQQARNGAVAVSPAISPGEKDIMRAIFDAGFPAIILRENGFAPLAKPGGQRFNACAEGRLLLLAPWQHHNRRIAIRRHQCLSLNQMAQAICNRPHP